jgi:hypothetical protein
LQLVRTLLDLFERRPQVRVCYDPVDLAEKITSTTRDWGRMRDIDEWCGHFRRMGLGGPLKEDGDLYRERYIGQGRVAYGPIRNQAGYEMRVLNSGVRKLVVARRPNSYWFGSAV